MLKYYVQLAFENIKRAPTLYLLVILTLSLGVGLLCANLALVNSMASDPIPHKSDRLFHVSMNTWVNENPHVQPLHIIRYRDAMQILKSDIPVNTAIFFVSNAYARDANAADLSRSRAVIRATNPGFFKLTDAPFAFGNAFTHINAKEVVIGDDLNNKVFGGGNNVGKSIELAGEIFTVVGILKPWDLRPLFYHVTENRAFNPTEDVFLPLETALDYDMSIGARSSSTDNWRVSSDTRDRNVFYMQAWVELEKPSDKSAFENYLTNYSQSLKESGEHPNEIINDLHDVNEWMEKNNVVDQRIIAFTIATLLFLCVCVFNASSLLLSKFHAAKFEIGLRRAIGASNQQMLVQGLVESTIVGVIASAIALVFSWLFLKASIEFLPMLTNIAVLDIEVLAWGVGIAIIASNISVIYPLIRANRYTISAELK